MSAYTCVKCGLGWTCPPFDTVWCPACNKPKREQTAASTVPDAPVQAGVQLIAEERERQISEEGWTAERDDEYQHGELGLAALAYFGAEVCGYVTKGDPPSFWPWAKSWFKPEGEVRNLVKAGALVRAERERLERLEKEIASEIDQLQGLK